MIAKKELEQFLEGKAKVKCAEITKGYQYDDEDQCPKYVLKLNHSEQEYSDFLNSLDSIRERIEKNSQHSLSNN